MLIIARRVIPVALHWVVHTGSRELFRLAVLAIALGVAAGSAYIFDVSFALGAFFAGMILGETPLSRRATEETLPLRDAFAVLFFVSVGMLFDPAVVVEQPLPLLATVAIIVVGKSLAAFYIVRAFGHRSSTALTIAASLAQIGEFSFILATLGTKLDLLPPEGRDLILAGAIFSIFFNPFLFTWILGMKGQDDADAEEVQEPERPEVRGHVILVGYGRVGSLLARSLVDRGEGLIVVEADVDKAAQAEKDGLEVVRGNAVDPRMLEAAGIGRALCMLVAVPEGYESGVIAQKAWALNATLRVIARAHSDDEVAHLERLGVTHVVMGERELARRMLTLAGS
jgi:CPA2 family monovalent cation:H+ antiporter-2